MDLTGTGGPAAPGDMTELLDLTDDALALVAQAAIPAALPSLLQLNRRFVQLFKSQEHGDILWWVAMRTTFGFGFVSPVPPSHARHEFRRLWSLSRAARVGSRWRFHGFEREGANVTDPSVAASEFEWRIEIDHADDPERATGVIWWNKLRSRHHNVDGMGSWEFERLAIDSFEQGTGVLSCHGTSCGKGLACANYVFTLCDGGLRVIEKGTEMYSHQQYMVGLAQDDLIVDPVSHVKQFHFPGEPPGVSAEEFLRALRLN